MALCAVTALLPALAGAQEAVEVPDPGETLYQVELADGSEFVARITAVDEGTVTFETSGGTRLEVPRAQIRSLRPASGTVVEGEYWAPDPNSSRLFFTSTGRSLAQGEAYVGTYLIVLPFVAVGLTDRFTLGAGAPVLFGEFEPFYLAPKLQVVRTESAAVSVGTLAFFYEGDNVGIAYGVGTFGSADRALTAGVGYGYAGDDFSSEPVFMLGGEARVSRRVKLITENYFLPDDTGTLLSGGIRFISGRLSSDVGVFGASGEGDTECCLPMVNFSWAFGKGR
jgi:hypothetical protein